MSFSSYLSIAFRALMAHKLRSLLTVTSVTLGTFAIVLISSLASSGLTTLSSGLEALGGARLILFAPKAPERVDRKRGMYEIGFLRRDYVRLLEGVPGIAESAMFANIGGRDVIGPNGKPDRTYLVGSDSRFFAAYNMRLGRGRSFSEDENIRHTPVCVIGHKLAEKLGAGDPMGRNISIGAGRCRVIGVLADNDRIGVGFGFDWVDLVVMPLEAVAEFEPRARAESTIIVKTVDDSANDVVKRIVNARLMDRHRGIDDFIIYDFSTFMTKFHMVFAIMELLVALIAGIALLIGGVGVMNIMLVSVSERVREIGIRKALGASPSDIGNQFLCEAAMLSGFGGALGVGLGAAVAAIANVVIQSFTSAWTGGVSSIAMAVAFLVSLGVGVGFGWLPARRAGALDPVVAIRR